MSVNGWEEYSRLVLSKIESLSGDVRILFGKMDQARVQSTQDIERVKGEIKLLHFKAGLVGLVGGSIPVGIMLLIKHWTG